MKCYVLQQSDQIGNADGSALDGDGPSAAPDPGPSLSEFKLRSAYGWCLILMHIINVLIAYIDILLKTVRVIFRYQIYSPA